MSGSNLPPRINLRAAFKVVNAIEMPKARNRRLGILATLLAGAVAAQALAFIKVMPLKERVPYTITAEIGSDGKATGAVSVTDANVARWSPGENNIRYFLARWAENLLTIDEKTRDERLPASYALLRGQAMADWSDWVQNQGKPLERLSQKPDLREQAQVISIAFLTENSILIRMRIVDNKGNARRVQINLNYALLPVTSEVDVYRNPIGLWITSFGVNNELA